MDAQPRPSFRPICPPVGCEDDALLARENVNYLVHRDDDDPAAEQPAADDKLVWPIDPRTEPNIRDHPKPPGGRVNAKPPTPAEPIAVADDQRSRKLEIARQLPLRTRERRNCSVERVGARSWTTPGTTTVAVAQQ